MKIEVNAMGDACPLPPSNPPAAAWQIHCPYSGITQPKISNAASLLQIFLFPKNNFHLLPKLISL